MLLSTYRTPERHFWNACDLLHKPVLFPTKSIVNRVSPLAPSSSSKIGLLFNGVSLLVSSKALPTLLRSRTDGGSSLPKYRSWQLAGALPTLLTVTDQNARLNLNSGPAASLPVPCTTVCHPGVLPRSPRCICEAESHSSNSSGVRCAH